MNWLCDASEFLTRSHCGTGWAPWLRHTYQLANLLVWFSYWVISLNLFKLYRRRKAELPAPGLFVLSTAFLLLCGLSHLGNIVVFLWAPYRLFTLVDVLTAAIAVAVACRIPGVVHWMVQLPAHEYVRTINKALEDEVEQGARRRRELLHQIEALKDRSRDLEQRLETHAWISEKSAVMEDLSRKLSDQELA